MKKLNCWEYKKCGREPGGAHTADMGVCPAAINGSGSNGGIQAGRSCWLVAGTYCKGEVQGRFAQKLPECMQCDFYQLVRKEEEAAFTVR